MEVFQQIIDYFRVHVFPYRPDRERDEQLRQQVDFDEWKRIMLS